MSYTRGTLLLAGLAGSSADFSDPIACRQPAWLAVTYLHKP